jgi:hypothetical protein
VCSQALNRRKALAVLLSSAVAHAQTQPPTPWVCPMDPDVRSAKAERCRKCGMQLVAGIPHPVEYPVEMKISSGKDLTLRFRVLHPATREPAKLELIHERLFHLFLVSRDLSVFRHEHPVMEPDGSFVLRTKLPKGGMFRLLCDFYPTGGTPQMIPKTIFLPGAGLNARFRPDLRPQTGENVTVSLRLEPEQALAGKKTMLFFQLEPADGLEPYLGAWGHLMAASSDLIDMMHAHPAWEERGPNVQFNLIFPRPGLHRVWAQFQRRGVVNTVAFNIPVMPI